VITPVVASVILIGLIAFVVVKGRWWAALFGVVGVAAFLVVFTTEPSESFQETTTFKFVEAGINVLLFGGLGTFVYGLAASAKPSSLWARRNAPPPPDTGA
jgi:K+-sensing histidine kinase KdpD